MVEVIFDKRFGGAVSKIKDLAIQKSVKSKIAKIIANPTIGKPMRNVRKGTREVYAGHFRISYKYYKGSGKEIIEFLEYYHKKKQ